MARETLEKIIRLFLQGIVGRLFEEIVEVEKCPSSFLRNIRRKNSYRKFLERFLDCKSCCPETFLDKLPIV